jgi:hypothetical protein
MAKETPKTNERIRRADLATRRTQQIAEQSRLDFEVRFAKTQQLAVATGTMALLGAILGIGHILKPLAPWEIWVGWVSNCIDPLCGYLLHHRFARSSRENTTTNRLERLQTTMANHRLERCKGMERWNPRADDCLSADLAVQHRRSLLCFNTRELPIIFE